MIWLHINILKLVSKPKEVLSDAFFKIHFCIWNAWKFHVYSWNFSCVSFILGNCVINVHFPFFGKSSISFGKYCQSERFEPNSECDNSRKMKNLLSRDKNSWELDKWFIHQKVKTAAFAIASKFRAGNFVFILKMSQKISRCWAVNLRNAKKYFTEADFPIDDCEILC